MAGLHVEQDVAHQERVFALDDLRAADVPDLRDLYQRDLRPLLSGQENPPKRLDPVAQFAFVSDAHGKTLSALHRGGDLPAPDGDFHDILELAHLHAIPCHGLAVGDDFEIGLTDDPVGDDG